jgi:hypothetical protein
VSGNSYSLSMVTGLEPFLLGIAWRSLAGLLVGWLWVVLSSRPIAGRGDAVQRTLSYGWLTIALNGLAILLIVWQIGLTISWMLPDFLPQFVVFTTLLHVVFMGAGVLLLAGLGAALPLSGTARRPDENASARS